MVVLIVSVLVVGVVVLVCNGCLFCALVLVHKAMFGPRVFLSTNLTDVTADVLYETPDFLSLFAVSPRRMHTRTHDILPTGTVVFATPSPFLQFFFLIFPLLPLSAVCFF